MKKAKERPVLVTGRFREARYLRAFFVFLGFAFGCGAGGVLSIRRSTSSGLGGLFTTEML